jgi:hypothetical protein
LRRIGVGVDVGVSVYEYEASVGGVAAGGRYLEGNGQMPTSRSKAGGKVRMELNDIES